MFNLGLMYEKRRGISPEAPEADLLEATRECYEAAAEAGVTKAMVRIHVPQSVEKSPTIINTWYVCPNLLKKSVMFCAVTPLPYPTRHLASIVQVHRCPSLMCPPP